MEYTNIVTSRAMDDVSRTTKGINNKCNSDIKGISGRVFFSAVLPNIIVSVGTVTNKAIRHYRDTYKQAYVVGPVVYAKA
jgi:hypothetical protein